MVKIVEFFNQQDEEGLPFNVVEDVAIFMRNNPSFYRKHYYPSILSLKEKFESKQKINPIKIFAGIVERAAHNYCKEYNVGKRPEELLSKDEKVELIRKIYEEELENIREGAYE
jgi:hypothetical protein